MSYQPLFPNLTPWASGYLIDPTTEERPFRDPGAQAPFAALRLFADQLLLGHEPLTNSPRELDVYSYDGGWLFSGPHRFDESWQLSGKVVDGVGIPVPSSWEAFACALLGIATVWLDDWEEFEKTESSLSVMGRAAYAVEHHLCDQLHYFLKEPGPSYRPRIRREIINVMDEVILNLEWSGDLKRSLPPKDDPFWEYLPDDWDLRPPRVSRSSSPRSALSDLLG